MSETAKAATNRGPQKKGSKKMNKMQHEVPLMAWPRSGYYLSVVCNWEAGTFYLIRDPNISQI